jgi:alkanesulfonate monooxygenase SsuD/methylene tetrahydromethanopterin reductase-like flavin-dependent oxidoreductase (luciferase family)
LGYDSLWTWDHLYGFDDPSIDILEGWAVVAGWAAITTRLTIGLLVTANTLRNPGVLAKTAVTVDQMSHGRCVLGIGSGWRPREHLDHGIDFGTTAGERLSWLEESLDFIRALLRGEEVASAPGSHYAFAHVAQRPLPVRGPGRLPILVGGGGEHRTLRIVARHADAWHHRGSVTELVHKRDVLRRYCDEIDRDYRSIECAFGPRVMIRDDPAEARRLLNALVLASGELPSADPSASWCGPPEEIAACWEPYLQAGFSHLIAGIVSPFDDETVERLIEVRKMLGGVPAA